MDIFGILPPPYPELAEKGSDVSQLKTIWTIRGDWERQYRSWKDAKFRDIQIDGMEEAAARTHRAVVKLGRERGGNWGVVSNTRAMIEGFKATLPLIADLRNPAMRQRHWSALMAEIGTPIDPFSDDFTLETVVQLRLDLVADFVSELSGSASKEMAIEESLLSIEACWKALGIEMAAYKQTFKITSTEDLFAALEDHSVTLSTIKASKFFAVFEQQIVQWEKTLADISETIELILQVQRSWMYLENIFVGSEDIQKQLPVEHDLFLSVHTLFLQRMAALYRCETVREACCEGTVLEDFEWMDERLEKIQKSLEAYLEKKRQQFPRFYFLSSDDLLEILGQSKDPQYIQSHLKKCFEGTACARRLVM